jgi:hypothetical protein
MKGLRQIISGFIAIVVTTFATSVLAAPEKIFSLGFPSNVVGGGTVTLVATIKNETPNGNSTINSLQVFAPAGATIANTAVDPPTAPGAGGQITFDSGQITIQNMSPLKPQASFTLTFKATFAGGGSCAGLTWTAQAWTGSQLSGNTFRQLFPPETTANPSLFVATGYTLQFAPGPQNAVKNTVIPPPVVVQLTSNACGNATWFNGIVTVTANGNPGLTGGSVNAVSGSATFSSLKIANPGTYTLTASAPSLGLVSNPSAPFTVFDGTLNCSPTPPFQFSNLPPGVNNINQPGYAAGQRGTYNKDGSACVVVGYTFINDILNSNSVTLQWDTTSQPGAAFQYTVTWKPEYVDSTTGMPNRVTRVAWYDSNGNLTPIVPGRACVSPTLPAPYGTLINDVPASTPGTQMNIFVNAAAVPPLPFPIVIDKEVMTVTAVSGTQWTVTRGVGGTAALAHSAVGTKYVMSTPLPLDGSGNLMRVCIVEEGWTAYPSGVNDCNPADSTKACVLFSTTVFDIGDGFISRGGQ